MNQDVKTCLFCKLESPATTMEHIIPESLGNDDLLLSGEVCDKCQNYFGKEVESYVLAKTPLAFWRTFLGIPTKRGELPHVDFSKPEQNKGVWEDKHPAHDNGVSFGFDENGMAFVNVARHEMRKKIEEGDKNKFTFVFTPKVLFMLSRFMLKVGLELVCLDDSRRARTRLFDDARRYARAGSMDELWPLFHFSEGNAADLRIIERDLHGPVERFTCYSYRLFEVAGTISPVQCYVMFEFTVGTDVWIVCLSDRYPHPVIRKSFPGRQLELIWYSKEQLRFRESK